jgi:hypothetical protein
MACATLRYQTINHHQISSLIYKQIPHPVNPEILEILIWLAPRYAIRQLITVKLATSSANRSLML